MKELVVYPDERLRSKSEPIKEFGSVLTPLIEDMTWVMRTLTGNGIGISAVQCGEHLRAGIIEMNYREKKKGKPFFFCNPVVLDREGNALDAEGCLSFPGKFIKIKRPDLIRVQYLDQEGKERFRFFHEIFARCVLHEIDHFDGILFTDRAKEQGVPVED